MDETIEIFSSGDGEIFVLKDGVMTPLFSDTQYRCLLTATTISKHLSEVTARKIVKISNLNFHWM
jgi:hypothetical protein